MPTSPTPMPALEPWAFIHGIHIRDALGGDAILGQCDGETWSVSTPSGAMLASGRGDDVSGPASVDAVLRLLGAPRPEDGWYDICLVVPEDRPRR